MDKLSHAVDNLDEIPEAVRPFYAEVDGRHYLQVSGMTPKARLDEFRDNNIALSKEIEEVRGKYGFVGDMTAEEFEALKKRAEGKGGEIDEEKLEKLVSERVLTRTKKMTSDFEDKLNSERKGRQAAESQLSTLLIDNGITQEAIRAGVSESALVDVKLRARTVFKVQDGKAVPMNGEEIVYGKDGQTPQTMAEWLAERVKDCPHWFNKPAGGGSRHNSSGASGASAPTGDKNLRGQARMKAARA